MKGERGRVSAVRPWAGYGGVRRLRREDANEDGSGMDDEFYRQEVYEDEVKVDVECILDCVIGVADIMR